MKFHNELCNFKLIHKLVTENKAYFAILANLIMLQGQLHIHFGTNLLVTQLWSLHGGNGLLGCATMSLVNGFFHVLLPTCQPNLRSVTFKQTLHAINSLCCLNNEVWFFCMTLLKHIRKINSFLWVLLLLQHHTVHVKTYVWYHEILCLYDSLWHSGYLLQYLQYLLQIEDNAMTREVDFLEEKKRPYCSHQNMLVCKNNEESVCILA
jgi:hypothetical protein